MLLINVCLVTIGLNAQSEKNFSEIDNYALKAPENITTSILQLSKYLTGPYENDLDKVRSIFTWITKNIKYDYAAYKNGNLRLNKSNEDVLKRQKAVCYGYSTLFKALCNQANIEAEVVSGYSKKTLDAVSDLGEADHAWNSVKIDGKWYLLDATWTSTLQNNRDAFMATLDTDYFLPAPEDLILNHLPSDPMWQLMDCIVTTDIFIENSDAIKSYLDTAKHCVNHTDTLAQFEKLSLIHKKVISDERAYRFHPTTKTKRAYGQTLMDYQAELSAIAASLQDAAHIDSLIFIQKKMIELCEKAASLTTLFQHQIENHAYARLNYAVVLAQKAETATESEVKAIHEIMKEQVLMAKRELEQLPSNFMIINGLNQCQQILKYLE